MEQIRSFIAIELPGELQLELGRLEAQLKSVEQFRVKWVEPQGIHLTLKFLGNIAGSRTGEIIRTMGEAVQGFSPFYLEVKDLGVFPNLKRAQVAWVGIRGEVDKVGQLQQCLEANLERLGFSPELRPFTPHLTLARLQNQASLAERQRFGQLIASTKFEAGSIKVEAVSLMRSQLTRAGALYTRLALVTLSQSSSFSNKVLGGQG